MACWWCPPASRRGWIWCRCAAPLAPTLSPTWHARLALLHLLAIVPSWLAPLRPPNPCCDSPDQMGEKVEAEKDRLLERVSRWCRRWLRPTDCAAGDLEPKPSGFRSAPQHCASQRHCQLPLASLKALSCPPPALQFVEFAADVCRRLAAAGHWADYIDPCSGLPMVHKETGARAGAGKGGPPTCAAAAPMLARSLPPAPCRLMRPAPDYATTPCSPKPRFHDAT